MKLKTLLRSVLAWIFGEITIEAPAQSSRNDPNERPCDWWEFYELMQH